MPKKNPKRQLIREAGFDKYFEAGTWREYNRAFFNGLAKKYDATNYLHCFGLKRFFDRLALDGFTIPAGRSVLDLCCGSGDLSVMLAKKRPDINIVGIDYAVEMLKIAERRTKAFDNIRLETGDCTKLSFEENSFDGCMIGYGLRNLENPLEGLQEFYRVLKPGGSIVCIDLGKPTHPLFKPIYKLYFYHVAPLLGKLIFHRNEFNSFRYLPESNRHFPDPKALAAQFKEAGFRNVRLKPLFMGAILCVQAKK